MRLFLPRSEMQERLSAEAHQKIDHVESIGRQSSGLEF
jgi:hypothetical protein